MTINQNDKKKISNEYVLFKHQKLHQNDIQNPYSNVTGYAFF